MPTPLICDVASLKATLKKDIIRAQDIVFDENTTVEYPLATEGDAYWHSLQVSLVGYIYCQGDEGDPDDLDDGDEPEFVIAASMDGQTRVRHYPSSKDVPELLPFVARRFPPVPVLTYNGLGDKQEHALWVSASAFDSDEDSAWEKLVKALRLDLEDVGQTAIEAAQLGGYNTPGAVLGLLASQLGAVLTDDPELIGSDAIITQQPRVFWKRPMDKTRWLAYKWVVFQRPGKEPWYLSLWQVYLTADAVDLGFSGMSRSTEHAMVSPPAWAGEGTEYASAHLLRPKPIDHALVGLLRGESFSAAAKKHEIPTQELKENLVEALNGKDYDLLRRVVGALSGEIAELRQKVEKLQRNT
jgi:hypothetical protein